MAETIGATIDPNAWWSSKVMPWFERVQKHGFVYGSMLVGSMVCGCGCDSRTNLVWGWVEGPDRDGCRRSNGVLDCTCVTSVYSCVSFATALPIAIQRMPQSHDYRITRDSSCERQNKVMNKQEWDYTRMEVYQTGNGNTRGILLYQSGGNYLAASLYSLT